jgi:hypothetical protein
VFQETLGRWHAVDLFFGLAYLSRREWGAEHPAADIAATGVPICEGLAPPQAEAMLSELRTLRRLMVFCQGLRHHGAEAQQRHWARLLGTGAAPAGARGLATSAEAGRAAAAACPAPVPLRRFAGLAPSALPSGPPAPSRRPAQPPPARASAGPSPLTPPRPPSPPAESDVLYHSPTAGVLRPAFAILLDRKSRSLILAIRGTHSRQDMFTSLIGGGGERAPRPRSKHTPDCSARPVATRTHRNRRPCPQSTHPHPHPPARAGAVKAHHIIAPEGAVLGWAHLGMLAAARWVLSQTKYRLIGAHAQHPDYRLLVIGARARPPGGWR